MFATLEAPKSFAATRWRTRSSLSRARFEAWQARALAHWVETAVPKVPFYQGRGHDLGQFPIIDKAMQLDDFAAFNSRGITKDDIDQALGKGVFPKGLTFGKSTGTSGNRSYFVISDPERFRWLGTIVAKCLADMVHRPLRVAIILPQSGALYESAHQASRIALRHFDTNQASEKWSRDVGRFAPDVIVASPKVLRFLVDEQISLRPLRVFSASETLDPIDRPVIEHGFGIPLDQIYMASEGLFATTCRHGNLHLCEDSVHFEFEPVGDGLASPIITSFKRDTQIMARYRMNDLLRLKEGKCACGSPLRMVEDIVGRMDDVMVFDTPARAQIVTPDVLRNRLLESFPEIDDFRIALVAGDKLELALPQMMPIARQKEAANMLIRLFADRGIRMAVDLKEIDKAALFQRKLKRIENRTNGG